MGGGGGQWCRKFRLSVIMMIHPAGKSYSLESATRGLRSKVFFQRESSAGCFLLLRESIRTHKLHFASKMLFIFNYLYGFWGDRFALQRNFGTMYE